MKKRLITSIILSCTLLLCSCDNFTNIDLPTTQLPKAVVFKDQNTVLSSLNYIYSQIRENSIIGGTNNSATAILSIYADDLEYNTNSSTDYSHFYFNTVSADNSTNLNIWKNNYRIIYLLNSFLEGIEKSNSLPSLFKDQVTGEALTLRSHLYLNLTSLYGEIPYITSSDYLINEKIGKTHSSKVYQFITADLKAAKELLSNVYQSNLRTRINKSSATALLARVYSYNEQWDLAAIEATEVINDNNYSLEKIDKLYLKESTSTIWHLSPNSLGVNSMDSFYFLRVSPPVTYAISKVLLNSFEQGDLRKALWIKPLGTDYIPYKYKVTGNTGTSLEYTIVLRIEEMYLIRAEAYANNNSSLDKSLLDLNLIRMQRGLEKKNITSQDNLINDILHEKQVEFFTEQGHRWFDLKRTNRTEDALTAIKPNWNPNHLFLPIPEKEILINPNLKPQNDGY